MNSSIFHGGGGPSGSSFPSSGGLYLIRAKNDGSIDVSATLQSQLDTWGSVIFPRGIYRIDTPISVNIDRSHVFFAEGARLLKGQNAMTCAISIYATHVTLDNCNVDCNAKTGGSGILVKDQYGIVRGCRVWNSAGATSHGICIDGSTPPTTCRRNKVIGCFVSNVGGIGISQNTARDNEIVNNTVEYTGLEAITIDVSSHACTCSKNRLRYAGGGTGSIGVDSSEIAGIEDNFIEQGSAHGIVFNNSSGNTSWPNVRGNRIIDHSAGWGIYFAANGFVTIRGVVNGNTIRNCALGSIRFDAGMNNHECIGNSINGVAVSDAGAGNDVNHNQ